jgi:hypothetical protein
MVTPERRAETTETAQLIRLGMKELAKWLWA